MKILIVEDERALADGLKFNFEQEGYEAVVADEGHAALKHFETAEPSFDLVVLDLMLPGMSGYEICEEIRKSNTQIPILILSARTLPQDKAQAFDVGTDQYMTKPFALPELLSRVRNLLQRHVAISESSPQERPKQQCRFGGVIVDFDKHELTVGDRTHLPTSLEMQLLKYFTDNVGIVLSRHQILENVWPEDADVTTRTIDNFVMRLRRLVEENPAEPRHILSVRGTGYRFVADTDLADSGPTA
jgi:two-component system OmpR family response regulator